MLVMVHGKPRHPQGSKKGNVYTSRGALAGTSRHPQSQESVERANGDIKDMHVALMGDNVSRHKICSIPK